MKALFTPPEWECRQAKANRLNKMIKAGERVSRFEMFPVRSLMLKLAKDDKELTNEIELLITEAKASF